MTLEELGIGSIEQFIAAIPQFVTLLLSLIYFISKTRTDIQTFPTKVKEYQKEVTTAFDALSTNISGYVASATDAFKTQVIQLKEDIHKEVGEELGKMKQELIDYKASLVNMATQNNMLVKENKVFMDMLSAFVSQDPTLIRSGIASIICAKTGMSKEELEQYPQLLLSDVNVLKKALVETLAMIGRDNFEELLRSIGYAQSTKDA